MIVEDATIHDKSGGFRRLDEKYSKRRVLVKIQVACTKSCLVYGFGGTKSCYQDRRNLRTVVPAQRQVPGRNIEGWLL